MHHYKVLEIYKADLFFALTKIIGSHDLGLFKSGNTSLFLK
ncbi:hypothetical protein OKW21_003128 [Catalinimonas alkaloidigena]|nr:hypothetical protein [Catalinimonas alkaloidigena]